MPPSRRHQKILLALNRKIADYLDSKGGSCEVDIAPFAVFLSADDVNYVEPDISVICDKSKLSDKGCSGASDWIVDPDKNRILVYNFESEDTGDYTFSDIVKAGIYNNFSIDFSQLNLDF